MKTNRFEGITKELESRILSTTGKVSEDYKNTTPLGYEERPMADRVYVFDKLTQEEKMLLYQQYGTAFVKYASDVDKYKKRNNVKTDFNQINQSGMGVNYGI